MSGIEDEHGRAAAMASGQVSEPSGRTPGARGRSGHATAYRWALAVGIVMMLFEPWSKGWNVIILGPLLLVVVPVVIGLGMVSARRIQEHRAGTMTPVLAWTMLVSSVLIYVTALPIPERGNGVWFGFLELDWEQSNAVEGPSWVLFLLSCLTAAVTAILLLITLVATRHRPASSDAAAAPVFTPRS